MESQFETGKPVEPRIVCYIESIAVHRKEPLKFSPNDLDPYACTHVMYAFASIDPHSHQIIPRDEEYDVIQGLYYNPTFSKFPDCSVSGGYRSATGLKLRNRGIKVLLSVGSSREEGSHRFSTLILNSARRRDFIRSAIQFLHKYNFDGLDIHWQYPGAEELGGHSYDKENFALFLEELSEIFKQKGWLLTISVPASRFRVEDGFIPSRLASVVDFVNLQGYDLHRDKEPVADHHAPLTARPHDAGLDIFFNVVSSTTYTFLHNLPGNTIFCSRTTLSVTG